MTSRDNLMALSRAACLMERAALISSPIKSRLEVCSANCSSYKILLLINCHRLIVFYIATR